MTQTPGGAFLYFIPGLVGAGATLLADYGLEYLATDRQTAPSFTSGPGPGGQRGILFFVPSETCPTPPRLYFDAKAQKWASKETTGPKALYVGINRENPPTPAQLLRPETWNSHPVKVRNGHTLQAPVGVQFPSGASLLPFQSVIDDDGHRARRVSPEYRRFSEYLARLMFAFAGITPGDGADLPPPLYTAEAERIAADILSLNYRAGLEEWLLLECLDDRSVVAVLEAFIDLPALRAELDAAEAYEQKKTPENPPDSNTPAENSASNNGAADSSPVTPQPALTSSGYPNPSTPKASTKS